MIFNLLSALKKSFVTWRKSYFPVLKNWKDLCMVYSNPDTLSLDLGCGMTPKNPFNAEVLFGVDIDYGVDVNRRIYKCKCGFEKLPFDDSSFDYVTAFDLIEHIPRVDLSSSAKSYYPFIFLMNEINRVLKPGGIFLSHTPAYPHYSAYTDPTHVNIITCDTFVVYFSNPYNWAFRYGYVGDFTMLHQGWDRYNLVSMLKKSKSQGFIAQ